MVVPRPGLNEEEPESLSAWLSGSSSFGCDYGVTVSVAPFTTPPIVARIVTGRLRVYANVATLNVPAVSPAGIVI